MTPEQAGASHLPLTSPLGAVVAPGVGPVELSRRRWPARRRPRPTGPEPHQLCTCACARRLRRATGEEVRPWWRESRSSLRLLRKTGRGGTAVVVSSVAAVKAEPGIGAYGASKAGAAQLVRVAAKEGARDKIRVNGVLPGGVETPIWAQAPFFQALVTTAGSERAAFDQMAAMSTPLGRYASADEIAGLIAFLLSDASATMTGALLVSDGGYSL
ncbi:SDR family oxidoreductase [Sorangium sp. So ce367]|uniref:SDR family oxidoreductase n=1 Tax=Sorangium sp. So ce367 TaxID=3133305 RepID=UPI003F640EEB